MTSPAWLHYVIACLLVLLMVVAVLGNAMVIWVFVRYRGRGPGYYLFINLAVSDFLMSLMFPFYIAASFKHHWVFSQKVCGFYAAFSGLCALASINTLATIAVERQLRIKYPWSHHPLRKTEFVVLAVSMTWLGAAIWIVAPFLGWSRYTLEGLGTTCSFDFYTQTTNNISYVSCIIIFEFVVPLSVMLYSYGSVWLKIRQYNKKIYKGSKRLQERVRSGQKYKRYLYEVKVARTSFIAVLIFCLSWLPYLIVTMIGITGAGSYASPLATSIAGLFAKFSAAYNIFIYSWNHPDFQSGFRRCFYGSVWAKTCFGQFRMRKHSVQESLCEVSILLTSVTRTEVPTLEQKKDSALDINFSKKGRGK